MKAHELVLVATSIKKAQEKETTNQLLTKHLSDYSGSSIFHWKAFFVLGQRGEASRRACGVGEKTYFAYESNKRIARHRCVSKRLYIRDLSSLCNEIQRPSL